MGSAYRGPGKLTTAKVKMAAEIREHLSVCGGSAHRDLVIDRILAARQLKSGPKALKTRKLVLSAFDLHHAAQPDTGAIKLFQLPFGEGSHRWALDREVA